MTGNCNAPFIRALQAVHDGDLTAEELAWAFEHADTPEGGEVIADLIADYKATFSFEEEGCAHG